MPFTTSVTISTNDPPMTPARADPAEPTAGHGPLGVPQFVDKFHLQLLEKKRDQGCNGFTRMIIGLQRCIGQVANSISHCENKHEYHESTVGETGVPGVGTHFGHDYCF